MTNDELLPGFFLRVRANSISHFIPSSAQNGWWECIPTRDISRFGWVLSFWHNQHELKKSEILLGGAMSSVVFFFLFPSKWLKIGEGEAKRGRENPVRREKSERGKGQWRKNNNEDEEKQRNKTEVLVLNKDLLVAYQINRPQGSHIQESVLGQQRESVTHVKNIFNRTEMPKTGLNGGPVVQWGGKGDVA